MKHKKQEGFTLIEILLYMGVMVGMAIVIISFTSNIFESRIENKVINEVNLQGARAISIINSYIRNAENINSPLQGGSSNELSLDMTDDSLDPVVFSESSGSLFISESNGLPIEITNNSVVVSNLSFSNLSNTDTPGVITTNFIISYDNPENRQEYEYSNDFKGTASLRKN